MTSAIVPKIDTSVPFLATKAEVVAQVVTEELSLSLNSERGRDLLSDTSIEENMSVTKPNAPPERQALLAGILPGDDYKSLEGPGGGDDFGAILSKHLSESPMPFCRPNAETDEELITYVNKGSKRSNTLFRLIGGAATGLTVIGIPYLIGCTHLIERGKIGYTLDNGIPHLLEPGWHILLSPMHKFVQDVDLKNVFIHIDPVTIVTVQEGKYGFAFDNGRPQVLLPGRHVRNSALFEFVKQSTLTDKVIEFGPISVITVETGEIGVGNAHGQLLKMEQGFRYEINSTTFKFLQHLRIKQRLKQFSEIKIATQDGVQMLASGLLTYQLSDIEKLISQVEITELEPHIERITKGALVNMFTRFPLKQIMQAIDIEQEELKVEKRDMPLLKDLEKEKGMEGASVRNRICQEVADEVQGMVNPWGVDILRFQLQTLLFYDQKFASSYENATLHLATTEVDARSADISNRIKIKNARADKEAQEIAAEGNKITIIKKAEGNKQKSIMEAEGQAEAIEIKAIARNKAAEIMKNELAEKLALLDARRDIIHSSKLQSLTMLSDSNQAKVMIPGFDMHQDYLNGDDKRRH